MQCPAVAWAHHRTFCTNITSLESTASPSRQRSELRTCTLAASRQPTSRCRHQHGGASAGNRHWQAAPEPAAPSAVFHETLGAPPAAAAAALAFFLTSLPSGVAQAAAAAAEPGPGSVTSSFIPGPVHIGWEVYVGAIAGVVPFAIGAYEFGKRIVIQRRCATCSGSGLVMRGRFQKKCPDCGGFFPWRGWGEFLSATASPGNGGPLRAPRGQTSVFYKVPPRTSSERVQDGGSKADAEADESNV